MIDTMKIVAPLEHHRWIHGGVFLSTNADGEVEFERCKGRQLEGSFDSRLTVRAEPGFIEFEGSPAKWFQGHNIFGTDDLIGLATETLVSICEQLELSVTDDQIRSWNSGDFEVRRADVTYSLTLQSRNDVLSYIRHMEASATLRHRGRGQISAGSTLYFGKRSRRWSLKFYSKGQEISAHKVAPELRDTSLPAFAEPLLRAELVLRSLELKRMGLSRGSAWNEMTAAQAHEEKMEGLEMPEHVELPSDEIENLPARLRAAYELHQKGMDTRQIFSRPTWYRHRRELLQYGIDLASTIGMQDRHTNVVPFKRTISASLHSQVPPWAHGTSLYFEPRVRHG